MWDKIGSIVGAVVAPIAGVFTKREDRKIAKNAGISKLALAKENNETKITLTDQEWEAIAAKNQDNSWKDEYVTIVITSPIVLIIIGAVYGVMMNDYKMLEGAVRALAELKAIGLDMGTMMETVVYAAVGLKMWRGR